MSATPAPMDRQRVATTLEEIATLLKLKGENPFKARAFENAARTVAATENLSELVAKGEVATIKGIGTAIGEVVSDLVKTGHSPVHEALRRDFPEGLFELLGLPGVGPKRAATLWKELGVSNLGELEYAIQENRLRTLTGFGVKVQDSIKEGLAFRRSHEGRARLPEARADAARAVDFFRSPEHVERAGISKIEIAGDLRRCLETVSEIVLVISCDDEKRLPKPPPDLTRLPLRVVPCPKERLGNALLMATGTRSHLDALAERARRVDRDALERDATTEGEIYARLLLPCLAPELREGRGEIEEAERGAFETLLEARDIKGLFHIHSVYSDGRATLEEIFRRAVELGYEYIGISEHSPAAAYAGGLPADRVDRQWAEIDALRPRFPSLTIFRGTEADILGDGRIDYGDDFLARFDFVIASVHSSLRLPREDQTRRLIAAVKNPRVTLLGHATGRLLLAREGIDVDMDAVLVAAGEAGCGVEINASPYRLELDWRFGKAARDAGVFTSINPDAHDLEALSQVGNGVAIARKAGFSRQAVLNAGSAPEVAARLATLRARG